MGRSGSYPRTLAPTTAPETVRQAQDWLPVSWLPVLGAVQPVRPDLCFWEPKGATIEALAVPGRALAGPVLPSGCDAQQVNESHLSSGSGKQAATKEQVSQAPCNVPPPGTLPGGGSKRKRPNVRTSAAVNHPDADPTSMTLSPSPSWSHHPWVCIDSEAGFPLLPCARSHRCARVQWHRQGMYLLP